MPSSNGKMTVDEFLASGKAPRRSNQDRALTQSILEDLEASSLGLDDMSAPRAWRPNTVEEEMDFSPPRAWRQNPLYEEGEEVVIDDVEELQHVNNNTFGEDSSDGEETPSTNRNCASSTGQWLKRNAIDIVVILICLAAVAMVTLRFGFPETYNNLRTSSSERADGDTAGVLGDLSPGLVPTYSPTLPEPTYSPTMPEPTYSPTMPWPTYAPTMPWPTYAPTMVPTVSPSVEPTIVNASNFTVFEGNVTDPEDLFFVGNNTLSDDLFVDAGNLTADITTAEGEADVELAGDNTASTVTTSSTVAAVTTTVDASSTTDATTTTTTATTSTEFVTTTTEASATVAAMTTTVSPYVCLDTTSGGKMFKLTITPTTSNTSLELFRQDENSGEYSMVTTYTDDPLLTIGSSYIKKQCILPGKYQFVVEGSEDACYNGFFRGVQIFENCGDGEYVFEF